MKTLLLLRHAKSSRDDPGLADHDRPLAPRGTADAGRIGAWMAAHAPTPDLVLCSTARRARDTLAGVAAALAGEPATEFDRALYLAGPEGVLARLRRAPDEAGTMLVVGHNPDLEVLGRRLAGAGDAAALARLRGKVPTAALIVLRLPAEHWGEAGPGRLLAFVTPRDLDGRN